MCGHDVFDIGAHAPSPATGLPRTAEVVDLLAAWLREGASAAGIAEAELTGLLLLLRCVAWDIRTASEDVRVLQTDLELLRRRLAPADGG